MVRVELQEQPTSKIESFKTSNVQSEAIGLLNNQKTNSSDAQKNNAMKNGFLEFTNNIYDSKFNKLGEKQIGNCTTANSSSACEAAKAFRPDTQLRTRQGREWQGKSQEQRQKALDVDKDGNYQVKKGDSLWTVAERMGMGKDGKRPSVKATMDNIKRLTEANPELKCNRDYLKEGRSLKIQRQDQNVRRPVEGSQSTAKPQDAQRKPQEQQRSDAQAKPPGNLRLDANGVLRGRPGIADGGHRQQEAQLKTNPLNGNAEGKPFIKLDANGTKPGDVFTQSKPQESQRPTRLGEAGANAKRDAQPSRPRENSITSDRCVDVKSAPMPQLKEPRESSLKSATMPTLPEVKNEKWNSAKMPTLKGSEDTCWVPPTKKF